MNLSSIIALVSAHNADPSTTPDHNVEPETVSTVIARNMPSKKEVKAAIAAKGEQKAPIYQKPQVFGVVMPERKTLDAKAFLLACRDAGKRTFRVVKVVDATTGKTSLQTVEEGTPDSYLVVRVDQSQVRNDQIQAIHAYIGYDPSANFGEQDVAARAQAQRELSKTPLVLGPSKEEQRAAHRSAQGFIAGLPTPQRRLLSNLRAREQAAVEAMLKATSEQEKALQRAILDATQAAIRELGF